MNKLFAFIGLYMLGGLLIWFQTNGQFLWSSFAKNPILLSIVFGTTISYIMINSIKYGYISLNGSLWSIQFVGFSLGIITNATLNFLMMDEGINLKTLLSIFLAFIIITIQFWK